ncbi:MAG: hypothetical protein KAW45_06160 [Thermoplasmatales archaeon]|nr:hypothetical protein [Thermoplasmatales archaeon]
MKIKALILTTIIIISIFTAAIIYSFTVPDSNGLEPNPDLDGDGLTNIVELELGTDPLDLDTDNDGMDDKEEYDYWTNRYENTNDEKFLPDGDLDFDGKINIIDKDSDNDGLSDGYELGIDTDPADTDSDDDGSSDQDEILAGTDPTNPDTDGDDVKDGSDINPLVDLAVGLQLTKFEVTKKVDILKWAQVFFEININYEDVGRLDNNGRQWWVSLNKIKEINHDMINYDIPDNTHEQYINIVIEMYDHDLIGGHDIIDISQESEGNSLIITLDLKSNSILNDEITSGSGGTVWYEIKLAEPKSPEIDTYEVECQWNYGARGWDLTLDIPVETYMEYLNSNVNRSPQSQSQSRKKMAAFVTSTDKVIVDLKDQLESLADSRNYNQAKTADFILKFVQFNVEYTLDNVSKGCLEYWRFPVETLVDKEGDCEDSAVLYAAIMDALGYDAVILYYSWEEDGEKLGHLAIGIAVDGDNGDFIEYNGKKYYYCETTNKAYSVGQLPKDFDHEPNRIIGI